MDNQYIFYKLFDFFPELSARKVVLISGFDNCAGDWEMRRRWVKAFGLIQPWWRARYHSVEFGFVFAGVIWTIFVE